MGGAMDYQRALNRNGFGVGDYDPQDPKGLLRGDLRRLEKDTQDARHIAMYVRVSGATEEQVRRIFRHFFGVPEPGCVECERTTLWATNNGQRPRRCLYHEYQIVSDLLANRDFEDSA